MTQHNGAGPVAPRPPGCASTSGPKLPFFTLGALMDASDSAIRMRFPTEIWVQAQVLAVRPMAWGCVLDLVDDQANNTAKCARISCNAGRDVFARIHQQTGLEVDPSALVGTCALLRVKVGFHPRYHMSLRLTGIDPALAAGLLERQIDLIRTALVSEGIFDAQHRLPAPPDVTQLVVIHPEQSASWSDVQAELRRWQASGIIELTSLPATFEGPHAASSLVTALRKARDLAKAGKADIVMMIRGGGNAAGLASLSDNLVARGLLALPIPAIVGLGHARDRCLLDELSWRSADTPSKALAIARTLFAQPACAAMRDWAAIGRDLDRIIRLEVAPVLKRAYDGVVQEIGPMLAAERAGIQGLRSLVEIRRAEVLVEIRQLQRDIDSCAEALAWNAAGRPLTEREVLGSLYQGLLQDALVRADNLDDLEPRSEEVRSYLLDLFRRQGAELVQMLEQTEAGMRQALLLASTQLDALDGTLHALDPDALLARGYTLVTQADGTLVRSAAEAAVLDSLLMIFADGALAAAPVKPNNKASIH